MQLAKQLSALPTNKLLVGGGVAGIVSAAWAEVMPTLVPSLGGPAMSALIGALAAYGIAWFVPDRLNVPAGN